MIELIWTSQTLLWNLKLINMCCLHFCFVFLLHKLQIKLTVIYFIVVGLLPFFQLGVMNRKQKYLT